MYVQVVWLQNLPWLNLCWTVGAPEHGPMIFSLCFYDLQVCVCRLCATMYIFALCLFPAGARVSRASMFKAEHVCRVDVAFYHSLSGASGQGTV